MTPIQHGSLVAATLVLVGGLLGGVASAEDAPPPPLAPVHADVSYVDGGVTIMA